MSTVKACNSLAKLRQLRAGVGQVFQVNRAASGQQPLSSGFRTTPDDSPQPREPTPVCPTGARILTLFLHSMHERDASAVATGAIEMREPDLGCFSRWWKKWKRLQKKKKKCCRDVISGRREEFSSGKQQLVEVNTTHASVRGFFFFFFFFFLGSRTNNEAAYKIPARSERMMSACSNADGESERSRSTASFSPSTSQPPSLPFSLSLSPQIFKRSHT